MNLDEESGMLGLKPVGTKPEPGTPEYDRHRKILIIGFILSGVFVVGLIALILFLISV